MEVFLAVTLKDASRNDFFRMLDFIRAYGGVVTEVEKNILIVTFADVSIAARILYSITKNFENSSGAISKFLGLVKGLSDIAKPGEILLSEDAIQPLMEWTDINSMGMLSIEGMRTQILVYTIDTVKKEYQIRPKDRYAPVVREEEFKKLEPVIDLTQKNKASLVEIYGPEGIGKTTFLNQLHDRLPQMRFIAGNCYNFIPRLSFAPFLDILSQLLKIETADSSESIHKKLEDKIKALDISDIATSFYILTEIFGVSEEDNIVSKLDPKVKEGLFSATIIDLLIRESWDRGLILAIEDIDHIDTASMNLLKSLVTGVRDEKILFVVTSEFRPRLVEDAFSVEIVALKREEEEEIIRKFLPEDINTPSGLPIHLNQYLRLYEDTSALGFYKSFAGESGASAGPLPFSELSWILERRIAILAENDRKLLCETAVMGMEINTVVLNEMYPKYDFTPAFENAVELGFLIRKFGHYRFSHAVIQRKFYEMAENKKSIHLKLTKLYQKIRGSEELVAFHYLQADEEDKAIEALRNCARAVKKRNAWPNALEYLNQALELARSKIDQDKEVDLNAVISLYEEMGDLYREMGDEENSVRYYKLVLDGYKDILK